MAWLAGAHGTVISSIIFFPWNASGQQEGPLKGKTQESTTQNELRPLKDILQPQGLTSCSTRYHILCQLSSWRCTLNAKDGKHLVSSDFSLSLCVFWNLHPVRWKPVRDSSPITKDSPKTRRRSTFRNWYMDVSLHGGTPKSPILLAFSAINHPFWDTTILGGKPHMWRCNGVLFSLKLPLASSSFFERGFMDFSAACCTSPSKAFAIPDAQIWMRNNVVQKHLADKPNLTIG